MKKMTLLLPVLLGAAGGLLRFLQRRAVFTPEGLARPHPLSLLLLFYLLAVSLFFLLAALRQEGKQLAFLHSFSLPAGQPPLDLVCGALLFLVCGALLLMESVGGGDLIPLIFAALTVFTGVTLLLFLRFWRMGRVSGNLLLPPVLLSLFFLLGTYQRFASHPVTETFYVTVLAQAAMVCAFHQLAAHGFRQGRRRAAFFFLPTAVILSLTALPDAPSLPQAGLFLSAGLCLFAFWRCIGVYAEPAESGEGEESAGKPEREET